VPIQRAIRTNVASWRIASLIALAPEAVICNFLGNPLLELTLYCADTREQTVMVDFQFENAFHICK
jgi:hypothetical protein